MSAEPQPHAELQLAHVLFIDVVGYSKLLLNEQAAVVAELNQIVRATDHFRSAEAAGKLIRIPTGDGMALAFFNSPEAPVQCAMEICAALQGNTRIRVRMGIHSGPVNSAMPTLIREQSRLLFPKRIRTAARDRRRRIAIAAAVFVFAIAIGATLWTYFRHGVPATNGAAFIPEKSIAVLPFDNFSDDKQNIYFGDGIEDDILTALSKVSDLKVISRSSVMQYRDQTKNMREIGQELGVEYLLEGSVRREDDKIRVTAQLID